MQNSKDENEGIHYAARILCVNRTEASHLLKMQTMMIMMKNKTEIISCQELIKKLSERTKTYQFQPYVRDEKLIFFVLQKNKKETEKSVRISIFNSE